MIVEFVGEPKVGKSTSAIILAKGYADKFNGKFLIVDTTPGQEAYPIFHKVIKGEYNPFEEFIDTIDNGVYVNATSLKEVDNSANIVTKNGDFKSIVFDSSDYLLQMAVYEYLRETGHSRVYPPTEWRIVRQKVVDIFIKVMKRRDLLVVFTSPVKDEYKDVNTGKEIKSVKTGNKVPAGFEKLAYITDVRIGIGVDRNNFKRYYKVMLSRYFDVISADVKDIKYYGSDISFDLLVNLMLGKINKGGGKK